MKYEVLVIVGNVETHKIISGCVSCINAMIQAIRKNIAYQENINIIWRKRTSY